MPPSFILLLRVAENFRLDETSFPPLQYNLRNTDIFKLNVKVACILLQILCRYETDLFHRTVSFEKRNKYSIRNKNNIQTAVDIAFKQCRSRLIRF